MDLDPRKMFEQVKTRLKKELEKQKYNYYFKNNTDNVDKTGSFTPMIVISDNVIRGIIKDISIEYRHEFTKQVYVWNDRIATEIRNLEITKAAHRVNETNNHGYNYRCRTSTHLQTNNRRSGRDQIEQIDIEIDGYRCFWYLWLAVLVQTCQLKIDECISSLNIKV